MSLEAIQSLDNKNQLLIEGANLIGAAKTLGLTEPELLSAVSRQYRRQKRLDDSVTETRYMPFFAEPGKLTIHTSLKNFEYDQNITGSKNQMVWDESEHELLLIMHSIP